VTTKVNQVQTSEGRVFLPLGPLLLEALKKFNPKVLWSNPVLLLTWAGGVLTTVVAIAEPIFGGVVASGGTRLPHGFTWTLAVATWLVLLTATFAESLAQGRGRAHTKALRDAKSPFAARRLSRYDPRHDASAHQTELIRVDPVDLRPGQFFLLISGDTVPADGDIVWGVGSFDESAITGESAPVIRESGGDRRAVMAGTKLLSDRVVVRVTATPGHTATDRMIALAEGTHRHKAPKELALSALLASFSLSFVFVALTLNVIVSPVAAPVSIPILVALVVCLIPTEIAALMSVTGIASMYQLLQRGVLVDSGQALEAVGDVTTVLFDKTGTITSGHREATRFIPLDGVTEEDLARTAVYCSIGDKTAEGESIIDLADHLGYATSDPEAPAGDFISFSAQTRLSGRDCAQGLSVRKGAESAIVAWLKHCGAQPDASVLGQLHAQTTSVARLGGTPLVVAEVTAQGKGRVLGVVPLRDVVKPSVPSRMQHLHDLGVKSIMITGDNPLTAAAIAAEAGIADFVGDATPQDKVDVVVAEQNAGHFVAMSGDGMNDAPGLAQADCGVAMNSAAPAVRHAANMVILDDDPTKIVDIIDIGRRQQATRGALITFNMANDIVRYFALFPALFAGTFPGLNALNVLHLHSVPSAILSTVIFSIAVMGILIPLALFGVPYSLANVERVLSRNLLYYGLGGILVAAIGIKLIDLIVMWIPGY
jgi:K+-transporting ATPase ATPase B chain